MSLKTIVQGIENLPGELVNDVEAIFNKDKAAFNKLDAATQTALKNGSGILAVINADLTGPYEPIIATIEAKFGVNEQSVLNVFQGLAKGFNLAITDTADGATLLKAIQTYLSNLGGFWASASNFGADVASAVLNGGSSISIGINILRYVYLDIVKPLLAK